MFADRDLSSRQKSSGSVSKYAAGPEQETTKLEFNVQDCKVDIDTSGTDVHSISTAGKCDSPAAITFGGAPPLSEDIHRKVEMRRRIIFDLDKKKGDTINKNDLRFRRAKKGMFPSHIYKVIGKKINRDVLNGEFLEKDMFS